MGQFWCPLSDEQQPLSSALALNSIIKAQMIDLLQNWTGILLNYFVLVFVVFLKN